MSRFLIPVLGVAALGFALVGCDKQPPIPGYVVVAGDSLTFTAHLFGGRNVGADWGVSSTVAMGWQAEDAQPGLYDHVYRGPSPSVLVVALGQNDAGRDGVLSSTDRAQLSTLLNTVHPDTRVVLVKPAYLGTDATRRRGIDAYRSWVDGVISRHPTWVSVDWLPIVLAHPNYLGPDRFHLNVPSWSSWDGRPVPAAVAYLTLMETGIEAVS